MGECFVPGFWPEDDHLIQYQSSCCLQWLPPYASVPFHVLGFPSSSSSSIMNMDEFSEDRSTTASKSHSQAEKRRRERINGHLATLRRLIPRSDKMDKAALLGSVIDHVKDLKRKVVEIGQDLTIPTDVDEVTVDCGRNLDPPENDKKEKLFIKASVCCDDRPELLTDLIQALHGQKLKAVKADMATFGGRMRNVFVFSIKDSEEVCLSSLKQSLKVVLSRVVASSTVSMNGHSSKRQRVLLPLNY